MPPLTLLIIYYPQSPEDNGENLETWVESSLLYVAQKPPPILQNKELSLVLSLKGKTLTHGHFSSQNASKNFMGWNFCHLSACRG